jgi:hypothetical protein
VRLDDVVLPLVVEEEEEVEGSVERGRESAGQPRPIRRSLLEKDGRGEETPSEVVMRVW